MPFRPGKLRKIFMVAVLEAAAIGGICAGKAGYDFHEEKALAKSVFGDAIKLDIVYKHVGKCDKETSALEVHSKREIRVCDEKHYSDDYSREKNIDKYGFFMHELLHIWQFQNKGRIRMWPFGDYPYPLDAERQFFDYGTEQQGAIIEDYARYNLYPGRGYSRYHFVTPEEGRLRQKLVEDQFPALLEKRDPQRAAQRAAYLAQREKRIELGIEIAAVAIPFGIAAGIICRQKGRVKTTNKEMDVSL